MSRHLLGKALTATVAALALAVTTVQPAHASATGTTTIDTFSYSVGGLTVNVPVGCFLTHTIKGSGKKINKQFAGVDCVGPAAFSRFCNWRIDFAYADTGNKTYASSRGGTHAECSKKSYPLRRAAPRTLPHYGKACAKLYINGSLKATQCHYITK